MHLNKLITFDMSFSYNMIKERNLKTALFSRNLDGYFSKVISVHPLAGLFNDSTEKSEDPKKPIFTSEKSITTTLSFFYILQPFPMPFYVSVMKDNQ